MKGFNLAVHEFREQLVHVINSNNLPIVVTQLILNEVKNAVDNEAIRIVSMEKQLYDEEIDSQLKELRENNENDKNESDENKNENESGESDNANTNQ